MKNNKQCEEEEEEGKKKVEDTQSGAAHPKHE